MALPIIAYYITYNCKRGFMSFYIAKYTTFFRSKNLWRPKMAKEFTGTLTQIQQCTFQYIC